ncbi:AlpA family phage regulatory protein [Microbulbifer sp. DLAB2-AF]|uniref:AlpA family phage regulatory protein n=2 Tax=unclassified Microbulbifer TaxID=2619833 RepID=UPI00403A64B3
MSNKNYYGEGYVMASTLISRKSRSIPRRHKVEGPTGYKRNSIYRMIKEGSYPHQRQIDPEAVGCKSQEIKI